MTKLCPRGKAAAKRKFKVYPSAYANAYASKICAGKIKDPSGTKRKDWGPKKASEGEFIKKPQPPIRNKKNIRRSLSPREIEYQKKKKAYDTLTGNENKRPRPKRFKKGALMIVIGVGKKKEKDKDKYGKDHKDFFMGRGQQITRRKLKPQKKMGGGMTAGSMSGMGRLQKARMMNKGGESKANVSESEMQVRSGREKARKVKKKLKNISNQVKGFGKEMLGFEKGGMADYYKDLM